MEFSKFLPDNYELDGPSFFKSPYPSYTQKNVVYSIPTEMYNIINSTEPPIITIAQNALSNIFCHSNHQTPLLIFMLLCFI